MFPHHENERAQAVAVGREFARHWMHNGWVTVGGEKMSKSLGNFTSLTDLLERSDPRAYRLLVLRSHYRSPIEVTRETIADAESGLARLDEMARRFRIGNLLADGPVVDPAVAGTAVRDDIDAAAVARFRDRMDDDLDTPGALAILFELVRAANSAGDAGDAAAADRAAATAALLGASFGLAFGSAGSADVDPATAELVRRRDEARTARRWDEADTLRGQLEASGWVVEDGPDGTRVRRQ
jgi:cysteinyl-tRNA synthetase